MDKPKYKSKEISQLDPTNDKTVWTPKLDGAHTIIKMQEGKLPRLFSHRTSTITGNLIEYTPKLPHVKTPSKVNAELRGETFAIKDGKATAPTVVTSILNSNVSKSLALQESQGLKTMTALIDLVSYDGKSGRMMSFEKKREILGEIARKHKDFFLPPVARTYEEKTKLLNEIVSGEHPLTREGIIEHDLKEKGMPFTKAKITSDHDVYVRKIFKEEDRESGRTPMAGGFWYSWDMDGPIVGKVGTGFSHILKSKMLKEPERYIGRVAKVKAADISANKALIKPSFIDWHVEKNISEDGWAKQTIIVPKELAPDRKAAEALARAHADRIYTSRETGTSYRFRQRSPDRFDSSTFRYHKLPNGIGIIFGKLKDDGIEKKSELTEREKLTLPLALASIPGYFAASALEKSEKGTPKKIAGGLKYVLPALTVANLGIAGYQRMKKESAEKKIWRERVEVFPLTPDKKKVFGGLREDSGDFSVFGGGTDGESLETAAKRELQEEGLRRLLHPEVIPVGTHDTLWTKADALAKLRHGGELRGAQYKGSRTHYMTGVLGGKVRGKADYSGLKKVKEYPLDEAFKLMTPTEYNAKRREALKHLVEKYSA